MASLEEHMQDCVDKLGKPYKEVHLWLDEYYKKLNWKHRSIRHHEEGVKEAIKLFGEEGGKAAEIHIKRDCNGVMPTKNQAEMWSIFGMEGVDNRTEHLSDFEFIMSGDKKGQGLHES